MIAASTAHNLDIDMERWGMAGVNYIANLIQSGRGAEAALLVSLPSYASGVVVAEENMRTVTLIPMKKMNAPKAARDFRAVQGDGATRSCAT